MRHAKLLMMVGGLLLATGPIAQGQVLFDENFEYSTGSGTVFLGGDLTAHDATWNVVTNDARFQNPLDTPNAIWGTGEIGSGIMAHFQVGNASATKGLSGGTYNLSNLSGSQVLKATFSAYAINTQGNASRAAIILNGTGGQLRADGLYASHGASGTAGSQLTSSDGTTHFTDLNSATVPVVGNFPARCDDTNFGASTLGCSAIAIDITMEVGQATVGYISRLRKFQGLGNVTGQTVVVSQLLSHALTDVSDAGFYIDGGQLTTLADNFRVEVATSEIPEPATLGLLGLGTLLLLRRRRA